LRPPAMFHNMRQHVWSVTAIRFPFPASVQNSEKSVVHALTRDEIHAEVKVTFLPRCQLMQLLILHRALRNNLAAWPRRTHVAQAVAWSTARRQSECSKEGWCCAAQWHDGNGTFSMLYTCPGRD